MKRNDRNYTDYIRVSVVLLPAFSLVNMVAPGLVMRAINKAINQSKDFSGRLAELKFSLLKSQISINGFDLDVVENGEKLNFLSVDKAIIQFNIQELLKGKIIVKISVTGLTLTFIRDKTRIHERGQLPMAFPLILASLTVADINLRYIDQSLNPSVKLDCDNIDLSAFNLTTTPTSQILPSKIEVHGNIYGGQMNAMVKLNLAEVMPAFDLNLELKDIAMPRLNSFFSAYGKFKVESGLLSFYTEAAAKGGRFKGYVKPIITNLEIKNDENHTGVLNSLWQQFLTAVSDIFKNNKEDQLATKLPIEGTFSKPDINVWYAIAEFLKNAFVAALKPSIDNEINIDSVKKS